jgi:hypothetical protein
VGHPCHNLLFYRDTPCCSGTDRKSKKWLGESCSARQNRDADLFRELLYGHSTPMSQASASTLKTLLIADFAGTMDRYASVGAFSSTRVCKHAADSDAGGVRTPRRSRAPWSQVQQVHRTREPGCASVTARTAMLPAVAQGSTSHGTTIPSCNRRTRTGIRPSHGSGVAKRLREWDA